MNMNENNDLKRAGSPESVGIPSRAICRFLDRIDGQRVCMHGFLLMRREMVAAEGYWAPYSASSLHRMYSVSKSFVSLAVGLMIDEGKLSPDDRIVGFFPDKVPGEVHPYLAAATIRDLLMMATPHSSNSYTVHDPDWAQTFLDKEPSHPPGTIFSYDTAATVILNTIVERISGVTFLEYMRPRFLDPIGFSEDAWCIETPEGTSWGGSGVICTLRDMAKVASVCLHGGRWQGRQLLPESYVNAATSKQIDNTIQFGKHGYGYQIWRVKENGFAYIGMGSQLAYCFPDRDFQFTCISDTQGIGPTGTGIVDAMYEEIYDSLSDSPLPEDPSGSAELKERIEGLHILPQAGVVTSPLMPVINGRWFRLEDNPMQITRLRFSFEQGGDEGTLQYANTQGENRLHFGVGRVVAGKFPQRNYFGRRIGTIPGTRYDCLASGAWVEDHKLNLLVYITDIYLGTLRMTFSFKDGEIGVYMTKTAEWFLDEYQGFAGGRMETVNETN